MFGKKCLRFCHLLLVNPFNGAVVYLAAEKVTDSVCNGISETSTERYSQESSERVEDAGCACGTRDKDKRVTRQEGTNHNSGFQKVDRKEK